VSRLARGALAILGASATALAVAPGAAWACSGGAAAAAAIAQAELIGWVGAGMAAVLLSVATVVAKRRGLGRGPLAAGWVLVAVHPGFWVSARSGDCGSVRATGTFLFTALAVAVLIWAFWRPVDAEREPEAPTEGDG
jgi:hypothetical protein